MTTTAPTHLPSDPNSSSTSTSTSTSSSTSTSNSTSSSTSSSSSRISSISSSSTSKNSSSSSNSSIKKWSSSSYSKTHRSSTIYPQQERESKFLEAKDYSHNNPNQDFNRNNNNNNNNNNQNRNKSKTIKSKKSKTKPETQFSNDQQQQQKEKEKEKEKQQKEHQNLDHRKKETSLPQDNHNPSSSSSSSSSSSLSSPSSSISPQEDSEGPICANLQCQSRDTPQWRKGWTLSDGSPAVLCNACGIRYQKHRLCYYCNQIWRKLADVTDSEDPWMQCTNCRRYQHQGCTQEHVGESFTIEAADHFSCPWCSSGTLMPLPEIQKQKKKPKPKKKKTSTKNKHGSSSRRKSKKDAAVSTPSFLYPELDMLSEQGRRVTRAQLETSKNRWKHLLGIYDHSDQEKDGDDDDDNEDNEDDYDYGEDSDSDHDNEDSIWDSTLEDQRFSSHDDEVQHLTASAMKRYFPERATINDDAQYIRRANQEQNGRKRRRATLNQPFKRRRFYESKMNDFPNRYHYQQNHLKDHMNLSSSKSVQTNISVNDHQLKKNFSQFPMVSRLSSLYKLCSVVECERNEMYHSRV